MGRRGPRCLRHALHGSHDRHRAAPEFPHAPRDRSSPGGRTRLLAAHGRPGRRGSAARAAGLRGPRSRQRPRRVELVPGHSRLRGHGGRPRARRRAGLEALSGTWRRLCRLCAARREPAAPRATLGRIGDVGRDRGQRGDGPQASLAVAARSCRPGPRARRSSRASGPPGGGRSRAGRAAYSREPRPGRRSRLVVWDRRPGTARAPASGLGGSARRRFRPLAPDRPRRAALPLRRECPAARPPGDRSRTALRP